MNTLQLPIPVSGGSVQMKFLCRSLRMVEFILTLNRNRPSRTVGEYIMITIESYLPAEYTVFFLYAKAIILSTLPISSNTDLEYRLYRT